MTLTRILTAAAAATLGLAAIPAEATTYRQSSGWHAAPTHGSTTLYSRHGHSGHVYAYGQQTYAHPAPRHQVRYGTVHVGPIWSQYEAQRVCDYAARINHAGWTGEWWQAGHGQGAVCRLRWG